MFGAALVAFVSIAIAEGFEGTFRGSGKNKSRSVAASLAEQDQERLRSFKANDLNNLEETQTHTVGGVNYTVESETEWVRDANGIVSCTTDSTQAEYMKLVTRVRARNLGD